MLVVKETQLDIWASDPSSTEENKIDHTVELVKNKLYQNFNIEQIEARIGAPVSFNIYQQGSFANNTNVKGESDVDLVIECCSLFECNLSINEKQRLMLREINYYIPALRQDVFKALEIYFGEDIKPGNKSLKIRSNTNRIEADIVPAFLYRHYQQHPSHVNDVLSDGIILYAQESGTSIINYPKYHLQNCNIKNSNGNFKKLIRIFKNIRNELIDKGVITKDLAPSYYIENLLYNCPGACFNGSLSQCLYNVLYFLSNQHTDYSSFICANKRYDLFSCTTWSQQNAHQFVKAVINFVYKPESN